ncbi:exocyst complex component 3-like protein 2 isoform X1 [Arapaima gigas]
MPILKNLPGKVKGGRVNRALENSHGELILHKMSLSLNPFDESGGEEAWGEENEHSLLDGGTPRDRNPFGDEEDENEANEGRKSGTPKSGSLKGTLDRIRGSSPLKTLGKLGKGLRMSGRSKVGSTPSPQGSLDAPSPLQKKKKSRRSSEGSLLRMAGRCRESLRKESLPNGDLNTDSDADSSRRLSFLKMVSRGKLKKESLGDSVSRGPEEDVVEEVPEVKPREPLSVLEILQLVTKRDLFLADTHILELEQECEEVAAAGTPGGSTEEATTPGSKDGGRRKAKDVELLYEALQKELWEVVRESLRSPTAGPNLGLVVQVLQQEEQADRDWAQKEGSPQGPRPRQLKRRWKEAVAEAADGSLPQQLEAQAGQLASYLDQLRTRVVEDLGAARRNVVSIYPEEYNAFYVYVQSYHLSVARRLQEITSNSLPITDTYSLLDWIYNIYNRDVLGVVSITSPINRSQLGPLLPSETVDKLELDCLNSVRAKVTTELSQVLDEEEKRWTETLNIEDFQSPLASTVIKRLQVDLDRSATITRDLGARIAQCSLNGLADFLYSFQRKVEMFHERFMSDTGEWSDGYVAKTIALVNCCPPFRNFIQRCQQCEPAVSEESARRGNASLDKIVNQGVKVLSDRLFEHIRSFFDKLVKRKWLNNTEPYDSIETIIKEHFKKFRRMDCPPYQSLVSEVHKRVLIEYLRAIMRGRIICTSLKMRKKMAGRLRDEGRQLKQLFKDLESAATWLDTAIPHLSEIILLEDTPSIQMEVGVLVREFPDIRKKHISAILNIRGMTRQVERQEILNIVKDIEKDSDSLTLLSRDRALFSEVPVTSEVHCVNVGLSRIALTASSCFASLRTRRKRTPKREVHEGML